MSEATTEAAIAADAIRRFNHATLIASDVSVIDIYSITADLASLGFRLHQSCCQLAAVLEQRVKAGGLRHDSDSADAIVERLVFEAVAELRRGGERGDDLGHALARTQNLIANIRDDRA
jgi:hypothetical protein